MEEEKKEFGLLSGVECKFVKTDPEIIDAIAARINLDPAKVKAMMRYNIFTVKQFSELSGLAISSIINKTRPINRENGWETDLDFAYPFADSKDSGPKFIVRNEKSEKYLK